MGSITKKRLLEQDQEDVQGSTSPFVNKEDFQRHIKPHIGGRQLYSSKGLRRIIERNEQIKETAQEKEDREVARARNVIRQKELSDQKKNEKADEKAQKEAEAIVEKARKAQEKAKKAIEKAAKAAQKEAARAALIAQGKKPRRRPPKAKPSQSQTQDSQTTDISQDSGQSQAQIQSQIVNSCVVYYRSINCNVLNALAQGFQQKLPSTCSKTPNLVIDQLERFRILKT